MSKPKPEPRRSPAPAPAPAPDSPAGLIRPPERYADWLADLKGRIHTAQQRATLAVNRELVLLYWQIGRDILARQRAQGWGAKVIDRLAHDLRTAFPDMKGFSRANLMYMRAFADAWPDEAIVQQLVGRLPWGHNLVLLTRLKDSPQRQAYARAAMTHGWSRNVLDIHIETRLLERTGQAVTQGGPTIGPLLCKNKNKVVAEDARRNTTQPMGVAEYQLVESLPPELRTSLPSIAQIERELGGADGSDDADESADNDEAS